MCVPRSFEVFEIYKFKEETLTGRQTENHVFPLITLIIYLFSENTPSITFNI